MEIQILTFVVIFHKRSPFVSFDPYLGMHENWRHLLILIDLKIVLFGSPPDWNSNPDSFSD